MLRKKYCLTKFEEELSNQEFWQEKDPLIRDVSYLQNYENICVNSVLIDNLKALSLTRFCVNVLFLPSYLYRLPSFDVTINEKSVNLLNCMYTIKYTVQKSAELIISLQQFSDEETPILTSYNYFYQETDNNTIQDISAGILGGKYLFLAIQQPNRVVIKVLNLDLTLHFEYQKEFESSQNSQEYYEKTDKNLNTNDMDYYEPGYIYYLNRQLCLRIDLINKSVTERVFEFEEDKLLIRILPVTSSEFEYYFRNSKKESLIGYSREKDEDKMVLFVIFGHTIYQLNMYNLQILRISKFKQAYSVRNKGFVGICQISVIPLQLKNRQRKKFSQWSFILMSTVKQFILFDWKENNLFQLIRDEPSNNIRNYDSQSNFRFVFTNESTYILEQDFDTFRLHQLQVYKKKGCKNYTYTLKQCVKEGRQSYFTSWLKFTYFCQPILYKGEITFPCLTSKEIYSDRNTISNLIVFNSFREQALKQYTSFQKAETVNATDIYDFEAIKKVGSFEILDGEKQNYLYFKQEKADNPLWTLYVFPKDYLTPVEDYFGGSDLNDNSKIQSLLSKSILVKRIKMFTEEIKDNKINKHYLPMIFQKYEEDSQTEDMYFGILDITNKQIIEKTIHKVKYAQSLHTQYSEKTKKLVVVLTKQIKEQHYLFFYHLDMANYHFRFVNFLMVKQSEIENVSFFSYQGSLTMHIPGIDTLIQLNERNKYEIKKVAKHFLHKTHQSYRLYYLKIQKIFGDKEQYIKFLMNYCYYIRIEEINAIFDTHTQQIHIIDNEILIHEEEQLEEQSILENNQI